LTLSFVSSAEAASIEITITKNPVVDLSSRDKIVRFSVDIFDYDPRDGHVLVKILNSKTSEKIFETTLYVKKKTDNSWGAELVYTGFAQGKPKQAGDYTIHVSTENGKYKGTKTFTAVNSIKEKPANTQLDPKNIICSESFSDKSNQQVIEIIQSAINKGLSGIDKNTQLNTSIWIPNWVRNNLGWYCQGAISYNDAIESIRYLIEESKNYKEPQKEPLPDTSSENNFKNNTSVPSSVAQDDEPDPKIILRNQAEKIVFDFDDAIQSATLSSMINDNMLNYIDNARLEKYKKLFAERNTQDYIQIGEPASIFSAFDQIDPILQEEGIMLEFYEDLLSAYKKVFKNALSKIEPLKKEAKKEIQNLGLTESEKNEFLAKIDKISKKRENEIISVFVDFIKPFEEKVKIEKEKEKLRKELLEKEQKSKFCFLFWCW